MLPEDELRNRLAQAQAKIEQSQSELSEAIEKAGNLMIDLLYSLEKEVKKTADRLRRLKDHQKGESEDPPSPPSDDEQPS